MAIGLFLADLLLGLARSEGLWDGLSEKSLLINSLFLSPPLPEGAQPGGHPLESVSVLAPETPDPKLVDTVTPELFFYLFYRPLGPPN